MVLVAGRNQERLRDQRGQVIILISLAMIAIVGVAAMVIDGSFMVRKTQSTPRGGRRCSKVGRD